MTFFKVINPQHLPASVNSQDVFTVLREKILQYGLLGITAIGTILVPLVLIRDISLKNWAQVAIYSLAYVSILAITFIRTIPYSIRSGIFIGLFFIVALTDLLGSGMSGEGRIMMMAFVLMATILAPANNLGRSIIAGVIALVTLTLVGLSMSSGWIPVPSTEALANSTRFGEWLNGNLVFLMSVTAVASALLMLLNQTQVALKNQERFNQELEFERSKLQSEFELQTQAVNRRAAELEAASSLARDISRFTDLDALLSGAVDLIRNEFGFYHAGLFLLDTTKEFAVLRAATGVAGEQMLSAGHRLRIGEVGIVGYTISRGEPRIAQDVGQDSFHYKNPILPNTRSELALPLKVADEIIGALDVQSEKELAFAPEDIKTLQLITDQLAVAIDKAQLLQKLQKNVTELETRYSKSVRSDWGRHIGPEGQILSLSYSNTNQKITEDTPLHEEDIRAIADRKTVLVINDQEKDPKGATLSLPLKLRENLVLGTMRIEFLEETVPAQTIEMLENITSRLALALDRARLVQEIQSSAEQDRMVSDVTAKVRATSNIDNILKTAAAEIGRSLGATEVIVQLLPASDR
jgi:GAF domain-containing protein